MKTHALVEERRHHRRRRADLAEQIQSDQSSFAFPLMSHLEGCTFRILAINIGRICKRAALRRTLMADIKPTAPSRLFGGSQTCAALAYLCVSVSLR